MVPRAIEDKLEVDNDDEKIQCVSFLFIFRNCKNHHNHRYFSKQFEMNTLFEYTPIFDLIRIWKACKRLINESKHPCLFYAVEYT